MLEGNRVETIKKLAQYDNPCEFFLKEGIPRYIAKHNGDGRRLYINTKRAFHEIMGYPVGIHASNYRDRIWGIHIMSFVNALRILREEGKVEQRSRGIWIWKGNGGGK